MIVFDASTLVSAALKPDSTPEQALLRAEAVDVFALSAAVDAEIAQVFGRPKFAHVIPLARRRRFLRIYAIRLFGLIPRFALAIAATQRTTSIWNWLSPQVPRRLSAAISIFWCWTHGEASVFSSLRHILRRPEAVPSAWQRTLGRGPVFCS